MKRVVISMAVLLICLSSFAQIMATTEQGKQVILKADGTWEYSEAVSEKNDTLAKDGELETEKSLDCVNLIETKTDRVSGETITSAKDILVVSDDGGKTGFGFLLMLSERGTIILSIQAAGAGSCIDDDDKMNVLFRDGSRLEIINNADFNCEGRFTVYFGGILGKKKELESFTTKEVETMRIWTSDGYVEKDFTSDQSQQLMKTLECLANMQ